MTLPMKFEGILEKKFVENYFLKVIIISAIGLIPLIALKYFNYELPIMVDFLLDTLGYSLAISSIGLFVALVLSIPLYIVSSIIYKIVSLFITTDTKKRIENTLYSSIYILYLSLKFTILALLLVYVIFGLFFGEVEIINLFFKYMLFGQFGLMVILCAILNAYA